MFWLFPTGPPSCYLLANFQHLFVFFPWGEKKSNIGESHARLTITAITHGFLIWHSVLSDLLSDLYSLSHMIPKTKQLTIIIYILVVRIMKIRDGRVRIQVLVDENWVCASSSAKHIDSFLP